MNGDKPYVTDNDNYIVDLYFTEPIKDANKAGKEIAEVHDTIRENTTRLQ
jgi:ribose 5-phosphate isomerase A